MTRYNPARNSASVFVEGSLLSHSRSEIPVPPREPQFEHPPAKRFCVFRIKPDVPGQQLLCFPTRHTADAPRHRPHRFADRTIKAPLQAAGLLNVLEVRMNADHISLSCQWRIPTSLRSMGWNPILKAGELV